MKFYERAEIKDVISYIRLTINHGDNLAFERIINVLKRRHNYLIDINYDLLTHLLKILNYDNKIRIIEDDNSKIIDLRSKKIEFLNQQANDINQIRDDFFLGKNFDYSYSVIDLLFLRGPESGFLIRNFNKKN